MSKLPLPPPDQANNPHWTDTSTTYRTSPEKAAALQAIAARFPDRTTLPVMQEVILEALRHSPCTTDEMFRYMGCDSCHVALPRLRQQGYKISKRWIMAEDPLNPGARRRCALFYLEDAA